MNTLFLVPKTWDFAIDSSGNIAMATDGYALAQDAASAIKTFSGECYYDTAQGVPYWANILGKLPPIALMRTKFANAALTVPEIVAAQVFFTSFKDRILTGQVQVTNNAGLSSVAGFFTNKP